MTPSSRIEIDVNLTALSSTGSASVKGITTQQITSTIAFKGEKGDTGPGVAVGGTTGQVLAKNSSSDYDTLWTTLTKSSVGLNNVDNTADANKPVSSATQTALNGKANLATYLTYQSSIQSSGLLEGSTSDGTYIYTTTTTVLSKYDYSGNLILSRDISNDDPTSTGHKGDLCYSGGFLYVGNGYTAIGQPGSVIKIKASDLSFVSVIATQSGFDAASVAHDSSGNFWISTYTGISTTQPPRVQKYDSNWNYIATYNLEKVDPNGSFGYDGIEWVNGQLWANIHENMPNNEYIDVYSYDGSTFTRLRRIPHYINGFQNGQGISLDPLDSTIMWVTARSNSQVFKTLITDSLDFASVITKGLDITVPVNGNRTVMTLAQKDTTQNPKALLVRQFADNEALRVESSALTDSVIEAYASGTYTGVGDQTAFNFSLLGTAATGQNARFKHNGPGGNVLIDTNADGLALYVDRDVTNSNTSTQALKISDVSSATNGSTYTKTGALLQLVNGVSVSGGSTITDTAQIIDIDQNNPNATNDIISVSSLSTTSRLLFLNSTGAMAGSSGRAVLRTDQNSSSSAHAQLTNNAGTGIGMFINQTGNGSPLTSTKTITNGTNNSGVAITSTSVVNNAGTITKSDTALAISSSATRTSGNITNTSKVLTVTQSDSSSTGNVMEISQAGTGSALSISGGVLAMGSQKVTNVADPTASQDAATKIYVDSLAATTRTVTASTTITSTDYTVRFNSTGAISQALPTTGIATGKVFVLKNVNTGVVTITNTIEGTSNRTLATQYASLTVQWNGSTYDII